MQKIVLAGFGFMGGMHVQAYAQIEAARLVAVVDVDPERARKAMAKLGITMPVYATLEEAFRREACDVVDICLPTDLHRGVALEAIAAGKAVFCEKPLALASEDAEEIVQAASARGVALQVGQCIRFWPEYQALIAFVKSNQAGRLLSLNLTRRSARPSYSFENWLMDSKRSLGALLDLHIHDTDFIHHLLGTPKAVTSFGTKEATGWSHIFTRYHFDGIAVQAEGGWNYPAQWGFQMAFQAVFEKGALEYDSSTSPTLRVTMGEEAPRPLPFDASSAGFSKAGSGNLSSLGGYLNELVYFIDCLENKKLPSMATGEQAARSVRTILVELASAESNQTVLL